MSDAEKITEKTECTAVQLPCYAHVSDIMLPDEYKGIPEPRRLFMQIALGDGMRMAGIHNGDILIMDKEAVPADGDIVTVSVNGEMMCRRFFRKDGKAWFRREDGVTPDIAPEEYDILSVVISIVHPGRFCTPDYDPDNRLLTI